MTLETIENNLLIQLQMTNSLSDINSMKNFIFILIVFILILGLREAVEYFLGYFLILNNIRLPSCFSEFPEAIFTEEDYLNAKDSIEQFLKSAMEGKADTLHLTEKQINAIENNGNLPNKHKPGKYKYYQIYDDYIIEKRLEWPTIPGNSSCYTKTKHIKPCKDESFLLEDCTVEELGKFRKEIMDKINPEDSQLIRTIFSIPALDLTFSGKHYEISNSQGLLEITDRSKTLFHALRSIERIDIKQKTLVIHSRGLN